MSAEVRALIELAKRVTGKRVRSHRFWSQWHQDDNTIYIPRGDEEGLLHEILHWVVATPEERTWPNLALDDDEVEDINMGLPPEERLTDWTPETPPQRERQACFLTRVVFAARGQRSPVDSSCQTHGRISPREAVQALQRLRLVNTTVAEMAAALTTGVCRYSSQRATFPEPLGARLLLPRVGCVARHRDGR